MRRVLKIWSDSGHRDERPESVTVELLRNGVVWDTVTLSERTSWRYVWENLDNRYTWTVRERSVSNYWPTYSQEGVTFTITNTYNPGEPSSPPPGNNPPGNPPSSPPRLNPPDEETELDDPDVPLAPPPDEETELDDPDVPLAPPPDEEVELDDPDVPLEDLPQTGQLWWPVPMLAAGGMFLFLIGWARNRREEADAD